jgi:hypothetical protein
MARVVAALLAPPAPTSTELARELVFSVMRSSPADRGAMVAAFGRSCALNLAAAYRPDGVP